MASELQVTTIKGVPTGASANQILVPTGQKLIATDAGSVVAPGQVIQVQHASFTSSISSTSGTKAATGIQMNFTPLRATSKLLCRFNLQGVHNGNTSSGLNLYVHRDGVGVTESGLGTVSGNEGQFGYAINYNTGGQSISEISCEVLLSANSTAQTLIALWMGLYNVGTAYINVNTPDVSFMSIQEVAQ